MKWNSKSCSLACAVATFALMGCSYTAHTSQETTQPSNVAVTLQSHHWQLQQALNAQGAADGQWQLPASPDQAAKTVGLRFGQDHTVSVDRLCNTIMGQYRTQAQSIEIDRVISTMMACSNADLMRLEKQVAQQLTQARNWKISGDAKPVLELQFANGTVWKLQGTPTHEALYGPSERIFLEVASQKTTCNHPLMGSTQCLKVRPVHYNAQGIKTGTGEWSALYDTIEGYKHQEGVRNVLRLKRFTRANVPADASKYVYVLDMTVESEQER